MIRDPAHFTRSQCAPPPVDLRPKLITVVITQRSHPVQLIVGHAEVAKYFLANNIHELREFRGCLGLRMQGVVFRIVRAAGLIRSLRCAGASLPTSHDGYSDARFVVQREELMTQ